MKIEQVLEGGKVTRYHSNPQMNRLLQTNGDHSWGVAVIILHILPNATKDLLVAALLHDVGERFVGDLGADFKRKNPELAEMHKAAESVVLSNMCPDIPVLSSYESKILKFADICEAIIYIATYANRPEEVEGWHEAISLASCLIDQLDKGEDGIPFGDGEIETPFWDFAENFVNPMLMKVGLKYQITPF